VSLRPDPSTHVVIDTNVVSWLLDPRPLPQAEHARQVIARRLRVVSFVTIAELRYGALKADWNDLRRRRLERSLADLAVIQSTEPLIERYARLRHDAERAGHPLGQKIHEADGWIATTALALHLPLVSGDGVFDGFAGLTHLRIALTPDS
jgi:tRNA(fMet)-specific endonuclease VapC